MNSFGKIGLALLSVGIGYGSLGALRPDDDPSPVAGAESETPPSPNDTTTIQPLFDVRTYNPVTYNDLKQQYPIDLKDPSNVRTEVTYDFATNTYSMVTKVGDMVISTPFVLSAEEYMTYTEEQTMQSYWHQKNNEAQSKFEDKFNLTDMKFSLGPADKLFGPGGVQVKMQGSAELIFGVIRNRVDNWSLSERLRKTTTFDFDPKIQISIDAKVGDKIKFNTNYNTEATFDFDKQMLKLGYDGKEDEIVKKIEVGNVSMPLSGTLIRGSSSLFGIKTDLQFGKLTVSAVVSQQQASSQSVSTNGGTQTIDFDIPGDAYDENRHYFLSQFFRETYDHNMAQLPHITSGITINRIEVWVTNKRSHFDQARNIIAFADLAEPSTLNSHYWATYAHTLPDNRANSLYSEIQTIPDIRQIQQFTTLMNDRFSTTGIIGGEDYEKIESARRLDASEYTLNQTSGFISLKNALNADEVLAVAFEYMVGGKAYQVGEFSTDASISPPSSLIVKLLKGTAISPHNTVWDLMMKNVYSLGATSIQQENFKLQVVHKNDSTGVYLNYIPAGNIKNRTLLKVMNLDRLDEYNNARPDGRFDFVEGYTILSSMGRIIFPVIEPFGHHLAQAIGTSDSTKYYFQELYDSTRVVVSELSDKNKFRLTGQYQGTSSSEISLNAMNVPRGSVVVSAGGIKLVENVDYSVDYILGRVTILNQALLSSNTPIDVQLESQDMFNLQRKTLVGAHLEYAFSKDLSVGGSIMHLSEMPIVTKTMMGTEPISNTVWGLNAAYRKDAQWLTTAIDKLPLLNATAPSSINFNAEVAQMIPGHRKLKNNPGYAYLDDFEATETAISLGYPFYWGLASTPSDGDAGALFPEAVLSDNIDYGKNRALLSWYTIDNSVFNRSNASTPAHIRNNRDLQSNHLTREVDMREIYPNRESLTGQSQILSVLNVSYYPAERGPYNLDVAGLNPADGRLLNPRQRWGGMMRKLESSNFEQANIEYIEFWLMDPFVNDTANTMTGGDLYLNLGDISEDVLKDGKKFFENGMPANGDTIQTQTTVWGRVPTAQSTVLAFSADANAREYQDVGFNGLRTTDEFTFPAYKNYLANLRAVLSPAALSAMEGDMFSPLNDPAGDNYHYYRGSDYDARELSILERYKRYSNPEGNSPDASKTDETYSTSASTTPDVEDINQDNTLNEYEKYYRYRVSLRKADMTVGQNFITDRIDASVELKNGNTETVSWYQFKIPIREYEKKVGAVRDFKSIRFIRMFMTDFEDEMHLRFGTLELVRGEWRKYTKDLYPFDKPPTSAGSLDVSSVNIEENTNKTPVNYVLPPGVTRETDPSQPQLRQQNEQAMVMKVFDLSSGDARAVYKNLNYDMRQYRRLQMFAHAEKLIDDPGALTDYELSAFIRLGSDQIANYYEYEIPLSLTAPGLYTEASADKVWPESNMFNFPLDLLTDIKKHRNKVRNADGSPVAMSQPYFEYDPEKPQNKITIVGNPNLGEVETIMVGVRNNGRDTKSGEVWINELRLTDYNEDGGWGALGNLSIGLSDIGSVNVSGHTETTGFGGVEQNLNERRLDDYYQFNFAASFEAGRFFPEKANIRIPLYYSYSVTNTKPKYNPLDQDVLLVDAVANFDSQTAKDSLLALAQTRTITKSFNVTNVKVDKRGKSPHVYDPANFSVSYAYNQTQALDPETERNATDNHTGSFNYNFATAPTPWEPFKKSKSLSSPMWKIIKEFNLNWQPSMIAFAVNVNRVYSETQLRDLEGSMRIDPHDASNALLSSSKQFVWDRNFEFRYELTRALKFSFRSATNSRIDETMYSPVNKELFPDEYKNWKDTVTQSLRKLGTPLAYQQQATASWAIPIDKIPFLDWITATASYNATYSWTLGANTASDINLGNVISNVNVRQIDGTMRLEALYGKSKFLKEINTRFAATRKPASTTRFKSKTFSQNVSVNKKEEVIIKHNMNSTTVKVTVVDAKGRNARLLHKVIDMNSISVKPKPSADSLTITVETLPPTEKSTSAGDYLVRMLMLLRQASFSYSETNSLSIPGFNGNISLFGQQRYNDFLAPGIDFAFGSPRKEYLRKAVERGWMTDSIINPAAQNYTANLDLKAAIEPLPGLKINLMARSTTSDNATVQHMYSNMPSIFSGTFQTTHVAIGTAFWATDMTKGNEQAFSQMENNRHEMVTRLQSRYSNTQYPSTGFMEDNPLAGKPYDPVNGEYSLNAADVLIPSFLAAYSNRKVGNRTAIVPSLWDLLPNWTVSYSGLSRIPWVEKHFKSVSLNHGYQCTYGVGTFSSYANYVENDDGLGFVHNTLGQPLPSSAYDIAGVTITESFAPLLKIDVAMKNNFTGNVEYKRQRTIALNISSLQVVETYNNEWAVTVGYIIKDFDVILKLKTNQTKKVKNDLTTQLTMGVRDLSTLILKIDSDEAPQSTAGNKTLLIKWTADYVFSSKLNFRVFFDYQSNAPYLLTSYPMSVANFGLSIRLMLTR
ncbi:MAG: cell surface protein SprA [Prevotellaceae bacterium]|jgi:cell surface protein SprA|nr:cell surface protein SprA [Prevotellaceae bacterium]